MLLRAAIAAAIVVGGYAVARANVPHTFVDGETLRADDLNAGFAALDQRIAALEASEPFRGTFPAVIGRGEHADAMGQPTPSSNTWFCGTAPASLNLSSAPLTDKVLFSNAFGSVVFTNAGALSLNLDPPIPYAACATSGACAPCPTKEMCAEPLTFFLVSSGARSITIKSALDNVGALYVDGVQVANNLGAFPNVSTIQVPAGPFALSFLACSNDGPTIAFAIYDAFLADATSGLTIDYDRTFHRKGR
jgi:hypothetical protein